MTEDKNNDDNIVMIGDARVTDKNEKTIIHNPRRYSQHACQHKGPYTVSEEDWTVECGDCGGLLNPVWCMIKMAKKEAYYNQRIHNLVEHFKGINEELKTRQRTKCTHCGNMTAIRFKSSLPYTWLEP